MKKFSFNKSKHYYSLSTTFIVKKLILKYLVSLTKNRVNSNKLQTIILYFFYYGDFLSD